MSNVAVTLTYTEREAREVARALQYFDSNVSATHEDHDRMNLIRSAILRAIPKPKPAEPTGLGAVVEDDEGERWIRTCEPCEDCLNKPWQRGPEHRHWQIVDAVRVLSEGVAP